MKSEDARRGETAGRKKKSTQLSIAGPRGSSDLNGAMGLRCVTRLGGEMQKGNIAKSRNAWAEVAGSQGVGGGGEQ